MADMRHSSTGAETTENEAIDTVRMCAVGCVVLLEKGLR